MYKYIEVSEHETDLVINRIDVSDKPYDKIEKIRVSMNMNNDMSYYVEINHSETKLELIL